MIQELVQKLAAAKENGRLQAVWSERLADLEREWRDSKDHIVLWEEQLVKEKRDVEKLKTRSFTGFLYDLIGKKAEKLSVEEQELLQVKFRFDEAVGRRDNLEKEIVEMRNKLHSVRFWDLEVEDLTLRIESYIHANDSGKSRQLRELSERIAEFQLQTKELKEAISAGESVVEHLLLAAESLRSARNWGTYDMLGGGMLSTHIKHGKIDEAMDHVRTAQNSLSRFEKELKDVHVKLSIDSQISGFLKFSDYFFDGLISDWLVQDKINETSRQVEDKSMEVKRFCNELEQALRKAEASMEEGKRLYSSLIQNPL
jgi:prefoldin subunit 5